MSVWSGHENGLSHAGLSPFELAPTQQTQLNWPKWGQHYETKGRAGEAPDMPEAQQLLELLQAWYRTDDAAKQQEIWHSMLQIQADQVFSIGVISGVMHPVVVNNALRNVPEKGVWNWNPGAHLGVYKPDTFWFADGSATASN